MDWSRATETQPLDDSIGYFSYLLDEAVFLPPNEPAWKGKEAIRNMMNAMFGMPGFKAHWQPTQAEAAGSGDLGYSIGAYEISVNDPTGAPMTEQGKYLVVWKKQADGKWKVAAESFNSDMPVEPGPDQ
jgi:ketosteroid isomerase-like protein